MLLYVCGESPPGPLLVTCVCMSTYIGELPLILLFIYLAQLYYTSISI